MRMNMTMIIVMNLINCLSLFFIFEDLICFLTLNKNYFENNFI